MRGSNMKKCVNSLIIFRGDYEPGVEYADTISEAENIKQQLLLHNHEVVKVLIGPYFDVEIGPHVKR